MYDFVLLIIIVSRSFWSRTARIGHLAQAGHSLRHIHSIGVRTARNHLARRMFGVRKKNKFSDNNKYFFIG